MKTYFIIDGQVQLSIYSPWKSTFERAGYDVTVLDCEERALTLLGKFKLGLLAQVYRWSRRVAHRRIIQSFLVLLFKPIRRRIVTNLSKWLIASIDEKDHAIVFVFKGLDVNTAVINRLTNNGVFTICLNGDSLLNMYSSNKEVIDCAKEYQLFLAWSSTMHEEAQIVGVKNALDLPFACEKVKEVPLTSIDIELLKISLVFIGVWDEERERCINDLGVDNVVVYGPGWERASYELKGRIKVVSGRLSPGEMAYIYSNCLAALNLMRPQNDGSHNMKSFEMPGCGAFSIMPNTEFHKHVFKGYDSIRLYNSIAEISQIVREIEAIEARHRNKMCYRTQQYVLKNHSYDARFKKILDYIN